jgi:hypothetical protein
MQSNKNEFTMEINFLDILKNYINDDQLLLHNEKEPIELCIIYNKYIYCINYNGDFKCIDITNFGLFESNKKHITRFVLNENESNNDIKIYKSINGNDTININLLTQNIRSVLIDIDYRNKYLFLLNKIKNDSGKDILHERKKSILDEIQKAKKIIERIFSEKIWQNINHGKPKHFDVNDKCFQNVGSNTCSITYLHHIIFANRNSYQDAVNYIEKRIGNNFKVKKITDKKLSAIFSKQGQKNFSQYPEVMTITNLYLLSKIIDSIKSYAQYLQTSFANIQRDPFYLSSKFSFNNIIKDFIVENNDEIMVQNFNAEAFVRNNSDYKLPKYYKLFKDANKWNIVHMSDPLDNKKIDKKFINLYIKYKTFLNQLDRETHEMCNNHQLKNINII